VGSTPAHLLEAVGLRVEATVQWATPVPISTPGVYVISMNHEPDEGAPPGSIRLSSASLEGLVAGAPKPEVNHRRAGVADVAAQLQRNWFEDEPVVYIGLASRSVRHRVSQFYATPIGAPRPHAGGWFLKMLDNSRPLWIHACATSRFARAELDLLDAFVANLSPATRAEAADPSLPLPFANLQRERWERKRHGISGVIRRSRSRPEAGSIAAG
jgi:hypothetical protein